MRKGNGSFTSVSLRYLIYALKTHVIEDSYQYRPFSESSVSQIYFELARISKNKSLSFQGFIVTGFITALFVFYGHININRTIPSGWLICWFVGWLSVRPSVRLSVCLSVCPSIFTIDTCEHNSCDSFYLSS